MSEEPQQSQATHAQVTRRDVEHVAALASLALSAEEIDRLGNDLRGILDYVAELQALDTSGVAPLTHVSELFEQKPFEQQREAASLRPDAPAASLPRQTVMHNAPATDGTFFKVPKVIDR